jgi:hypothetical protein
MVVDFIRGVRGDSDELAKKMEPSSRSFRVGGCPEAVADRLHSLESKGFWDSEGLEELDEGISGSSLR